MLKGIPAFEFGRFAFEVALRAIVFLIRLLLQFSSLMLPIASVQSTGHWLLELTHMCNRR
jgi:hypothetical protein